MDAEDFGHFESGKREGRVFFGGNERRKISGARATNRERRPRDREPHILSSEPRAGLAGARPSRIECDAVAARNNHWSRDDIVPSAVRRRHAAVANERADAAANRGGTWLPRRFGKYRSARLGEAGRGHHFATSETATAGRQHHFV